MTYRKIIPLLLIISVHLLVLTHYSTRFDGNITGFLCIGEKFAAPFIRGDDTVILKDSVGYDGQFYYYISHDPFMNDPQLHKYIHLTPYRYQRILYPLIVNLLSFNNPTLNPYMMVLVNLLSVVGGTVFIIKILEHYNLNTWHCLWFGVLPGLFISTLRSCSEPVATVFVLGGIYWYIKDKPVGAVISFSLACLTREVSLIFPASIILVEMINHRSFKKVLSYTLPFLIYILWQCFIFIRLGTFPFEMSPGHRGIPLTGFFRQVMVLIKNPVSPARHYKMFELFFLLFTVLSLLGYAAYLFIKKEKYTLFSFSFLMYTLVAITSSDIIWADFWGYGRLFNDAFLLLFLLFVNTKDKNYMLPVYGSSAFSAALVYFKFF